MKRIVFFKKRNRFRDEKRSRLPENLTIFLAVLVVWGAWIVISHIIPDGDDLQRRKLVVLTRNAPTIYYEGPSGAAGFEYEMIKAFADYLDLELELKILHGVSDILEAMEKGEGDIAAAALTRTEQREEEFVFGPDYHTVQQYVVCNRFRDRPASPADLPVYELVVREHSSYAERLAELQATVPGLQWRVVTDISTEQLLEQVASGALTCTIADSNIIDINRRYYPELTKAFALGEEQKLAWILNDDDEDLQEELNKWFIGFEQSGELAKLRERYFAYTEIFNYVDLAVFHRHIEKRLPIYKDIFQQAADDHDIPFELLAAQGYQESHWNPRAKSPTGVRGIMMLTRPTAKAMGVKYRLDPAQSIHGGAKYLARVLKRVPDSVTDPEERLKFALAAYNVGMGHIRDAMELARRLGRDPNSWSGLKTVLPLLAQRKYYKTLKHGYARGTEPVRYVDRIMVYRDILHNGNMVADQGQAPAG